MDKYEESLVELDALLANTATEEFEKDYLAVESNIGITVEDYLSQECSSSIEHNQMRFKETN